MKKRRHKSFSSFLEAQMAELGFGPIIFQSHRKSSSLLVCVTSCSHEKLCQKYEACPELCHWGWETPAPLFCSKAGEARRPGEGRVVGLRHLKENPHPPRKESSSPCGEFSISQCGLTWPQSRSNCLLPLEGLSENVSSCVSVSEIAQARAQMAWLFSRYDAAGFPELTQVSLAPLQKLQVTKPAAQGRWWVTGSNGRGAGGPAVGGAHGSLKTRSKACTCTFLKDRGERGVTGAVPRMGPQVQWVQDQCFLYQDVSHFKFIKGWLLKVSSRATYNIPPLLTCVGQS